jgi:hypothetical protein
MSGVSGTPDAISTNKSTNTDSFYGAQARVICRCIHKSTNTDAFGGPQVCGETVEAEFELFEFANEFSSEFSILLDHMCQTGDGESHRETD